MRKDRVLAGALAAVTALSMTACGGGQAGGTTQAAAAGTQAAVENTANPNACLLYTSPSPRDTR